MTIAWVLLATWALASVAGIFTLTFVPDGLRRALLPALPAVGIAALVVVLELVGFVLPARVALLVIAAVAVVIAIVFGRRRSWRVSRRDLTRLGAASLAGLLPLFIALLPVLRVGEATVVQPSANNDASVHVSLSNWLIDNPASQVPDRPPEDAPGYGYVRHHLQLPLRIGQDLVQAAVSSATGEPMTHSFSIVLAFWLFMLPGVGMAAARLLGMRDVTGVLFGVLAGAWTATVDQVYDQNAAAVLGIVLAPLAIALTVRAVERAPEVPLWFAGAALGALVGVYAEYLPLLAIVLGGYVLVRGIRSRPTLVRGIGVATCSVLLAPTAWVTAVGGLAQQGGLGARAGYGSMFYGIPGPTILTRLSGVYSLDTTATTRPMQLVALLVAVFVLAGVGLAIAVRRDRSLWVLTVLAVLVVVTYLSTGDRDRYSQQRAVELGVPLLLLGAAAGYDALVRRHASPRLSPRVLRAATASIAGVVVALTVANVLTSVDTKDANGRFLALRTVDDSFEEAAGWARDVGGPGGRGVVVLATSFFDQEWALVALRDEPRVLYPVLYADWATPIHFVWHKKVPRYALVERTAYLDAADAVVVRQNSRFRLLDLQRGPALVTALEEGWYAGEVHGDSVRTWMHNIGALFLLRSPDAGNRVVLTVRTLPQLAPLEIKAEVDGVLQPPVVVGTEPKTIEIVAFPGGDISGVILHNNKAGVPSFDDGLVRSLQLLDVRRG